MREMSSRKMEDGGENVKGRPRDVEARIALTFLDSCWALFWLALQHQYQSSTMQDGASGTSEVLELQCLKSLQAENHKCGACLPLPALSPPEPSGLAAAICQSCSVGV